MRYNPKARLDTSEVEVRSGSGGGGLGIPGLGGGGGGLKIGGGIGGIIVLILIVLLNGGLPGGGSDTTGSTGTSIGGNDDTGSTSSLSQCQTGADANNDESCALVADVDAIQSFWSTELPKQADVRYTNAQAVFFSGSTSSGCGEAQSAMGPFYCPVDKHVYLDRSFFKDMLQGELGAKGGPFAEAYVLAHEYGHHVQDLLGTMSKVHTQQGPTSDSVRLELQADCFAGIWTKYATTAKDADGNTYIEGLTQDDINRAIDSAKAVGDDAIQKETSGRVNPEQWTHGSSAERVHWFSVGMQDGTIKACDTFSAQSLD